MMMKQAGLKLRDWQRRWRAAVLGMCGGEIDRGRKMKGGERRVWWSGISWVLVGCVCTATCAHVLCVCVFVSPRLWEFLGFACFLKRDSTLLLLILNSYCSLSLSHTHTHSLSVLFVCLSSSLLSLYPSILSHQGLLSGGPICRSSSANLIGDRLSLAWHGDELPNPFSPPARGSLCSALVQRRSLTQRLQPQRLQPQRRPRLRPRIQRSVCDDLRKKKKSNAPNARCPDGFKSCSSHLMLFRQT